MKISNKNFFILLLAIGAGLIAYNYWDTQVKTNVAVDAGLHEDYSWLDTYKTNILGADLEKAPKVIRSPEVSNTVSGLMEKELYVDAVYKSTCLLFSQNNVFTEELNNEIKNIFLANKLPADNTISMNKIIKKYKDDPDYLNAVLSAGVNCNCKDSQLFDKANFECVLNPEFFDKNVRE